MIRKNIIQGMNSRMVIILVTALLPMSFKIMDNENNSTIIKFRVTKGTFDNYEIDDKTEVESDLSSSKSALKSSNKNEFSTVIKLGINFPYDSNLGCNSIFHFDSRILNFNYGKELNPYGNQTPSVLQKSQKAFQGANFNVTLQENGKITEIKGIDTFNKKYQEIYRNEVKESNNYINVNKYPNSKPEYREEYFYDLFELLTDVLPNAGIKLNSKWEKMESLEIGGQKIVPTTFNCYRIENGIAYIQTHAEFKDVKISQSNQMEMNGIGEGTCLIDIKTGKLLSRDVILTMKGDTKIGGPNLTIIKNRRLIIKRIDHGEFSPG